MKCISIIEQASKEAIRTFAEKRNLTEHFSKSYTHPQEDYLIASDELPVFVVSDGVTLNFNKLIENKIEYPNPSPAGEIAKIFCEAVQESAKKRYLNFNENNIKDVFNDGNSAVSKYNKKIGQNDISGNITGYYSATGSYAILKNNKAYWATICDAFFAHFDKDMNLKFMSSGLCSPYAVINGEERMASYIEQGTVSLKEGDRLFIFTDGFEHYFRNSHFIDIFRHWSDNFKDSIEEFSVRMNLENPEKYGHERSMIAILND